MSVTVGFSAGSRALYALGATLQLVPFRSQSSVAGLCLPDPALTPAQRVEMGRRARKLAPRKEQGVAVNQSRLSALDIIAEQDRGRIPPLVPLRHQRMSVSPFAFFRGTAAVQASDLGLQPHSGLVVQLCGDAHLANFGLFGARDRATVFDINDFDETHPGPFEWDLKRLCSSVFLAARDIGVSAAEAQAACVATAATYRRSMSKFATLPAIDMWYYRIGQGQLTAAARQIPSDLQRAVAKGLTAAQKRTGWSAVNKLTYLDDGRRRFRTIDPVLTPIPPGHRDLVEELFARYVESLPLDRQLLIGRYRIVDVAFKVVGVGSVGLLAVAVLLQGRDESDLLALQLKEARASVLESYTPPSVFANHGQRVVVGQSLIQAAGDQFLGWLAGLQGREHYVRQLRDMKWSPQLAGLQFNALATYAKACANALARAHARTGDALAISGYLGRGSVFDVAMGNYASSYALCAAQDYEEFLGALTLDKEMAVSDSLAAWWDAALSGPAT